MSKDFSISFHFLSFFKEMKKVHHQMVPLTNILEILLVFIVINTNYALSNSDIHIGYSVTLAIPIEFNIGFIGKAFLMETSTLDPKFKVALSVEAVSSKGRYSCSLQVFLGDVRVWDSGHYSRFFTSEKCVLEFNEDGDLQLKGSNLDHQIGWRTGTYGQGVERLQIQNTGNLVLVDALNRTKWQSFNFPTDVMLLGQRLNVATRLTSFPVNSTSFYTMEIKHNRISLYLSSNTTALGMLNYTYWEYSPTNFIGNITYIELSSKGLVFFDYKYEKIMVVTSNATDPLRFMALQNRTGNLGLYYYNRGSFFPGFQAINSTCDLPLACRPYGVCTLSNTCSCIRVSNHGNRTGSGCGFSGFPEGFCGNYSSDQVEMFELNGVTTVLRTDTKSVSSNVTKETCASLCLQECKCVAALHLLDTTRNLVQCFVYGVVMGVKQIDSETTRASSSTMPSIRFMVKVPKGSHIISSETHSLKQWVLILIGVVDSFVIFVIFVGFLYYFIWRRKNSPGTENVSSRHSS